MTTYQFQTLDVPGASWGTWVYGINDKGVVSGAYTLGLPNDPYAQAFIRNADGSINTFGANGLPYGQHSNGYDIDNGGQVVGASGHYEQTARGFVWQTDGSFTRVEHTGDHATTAAYGINDDGTVVGAAAPFGPPFPPGAPVGFEWKDGQVIDTFAVPGANATTANDINNFGMVVGTYTVGTYPNDTQHGFVALNGHAMWGLDMPGAVSTDLSGITDDYEIVGTFTSADGHHHGFVDIANHLSEIDVPGATDTFIYGVNKAGQVVGSYKLPDDPLSLNAHGFEASPLDPQQCIVDRAYIAGLHREADPGGLNYWADRLKAGMPPSQLAQELASSAEFQSLHGQQSDRDYVDSLYGNGLGRQADADGEAYWLGVLQSGASRGYLLDAIAQSSEGQQYFAMVGHIG